MTREVDTIVGGEVVQGSYVLARVRNRRVAGNVVLDIQGVLPGHNGIRGLDDGTHRVYITGPLDQRQAERRWECVSVIAVTKRRVTTIKAFIQRHPFASVYVAAVLTYNIQEWIK